MTNDLSFATQSLFAILNCALFERILGLFSSGDQYFFLLSNGHIEYKSIPPIKIFLIHWLKYSMSCYAGTHFDCTSILISLYLSKCLKKTILKRFFYIFINYNLSADCLMHTLMIVCFPVHSANQRASTTTNHYCSLSSQS